MNIDERIEALTQSVELLSHMHLDNEKRYLANEKRNVEFFRVVSESLQTLTRIAEVHDARIRKLEDNNPH